VRASDLDLRELLDFDPKGGVLRFAGQRAVILDTVALGLLRKELIATVGVTAARGILTRFGYAHGWRAAETLRDAFPWDDEREWRIAGGRLHRLKGLVLFEPIERKSKQNGDPFAEATWRESFEAEQHLLHHGRAEEPVCWMLSGFASGYLSAVNGVLIFCCEDRCVGKGDAVCTMIGRTKEEWGDALAEIAPYFEGDCLNEALRRTTSALKEAERKLSTTKGKIARDGDASHDGIVAKSAEMRHALDVAKRVSQVDSTVLITGESGVGKEVVARAIHEEGDRLDKPFVAINCGAVPEGLLESELFGHAKGSFTGATSDRAGLFEAANGGTLFLDEIGDVPPAMQVKLLRALEQREVRRVGENKSRPVNVRVVAATHRDLAARVAEGHFRQDLYYRLRVIEIRIPPLRDRKDDILPLARTFLARVATRLGRDVRSFSPEAAQQLFRYEWPGNVRELHNAIERAVVLSRTTRVDASDLPEEVAAALPQPIVSGSIRPLADVEREYILSALRSTGGNKARAAAELDIGTATLFRKLKQYEGDAE
jgi:DNA-binding NtrC family response regulator